MVTSFFIFWFGREHRRAPQVLLFDVSTLGMSEINRRRLWMAVGESENLDHAPWV